MEEVTDVPNTVTNDSTLASKDTLATDLPQETDDVNNIHSVDTSQKVVSVGDTGWCSNQDPTGIPH